MDSKAVCNLKWNIQYVIRSNIQFTKIEFWGMMKYNKSNRTQHASQRCGPRWVF